MNSNATTDDLETDPENFTRALYRETGYYYAGGLDDGPVHVDVPGEVEEIPEDLQRLADEHDYALVEEHGYDAWEDSTLFEFHRVETDGGDEEEADDRDLPAEFGLAGQEAGRPVDILDYVQPGDRILWEDRTVPCVVARVVEPDDPVGQSLTASVIRGVPDRDDDPGWTEPEFGRDLRSGDVFLNPNAWGTLTGKKFVLIQGPRGGFYAVTRDEKNPRNAVLFRAVRSYHRTRYGQKGQGAFAYEGSFDGPVTVVEAGDEPDDLDPGGDLPRYEDIAENTLLSYDREIGEHFEVSTVAEAFEEGLESAVNRAAREFSALYEDDEGDAGPWAEVPDPDRVSGTPRGYSHSTVTVTEIIETEYGLKAVLDGPAPWETPDDETPLNEVLKSTPWEETHASFDSDRKAWTVDADELSRVASVLRDEGYSVLDEADRDE